MVKGKGQGNQTSNDRSKGNQTPMVTRSQSHQASTATSAPQTPPTPHIDEKKEQTSSPAPLSDGQAQTTPPLAPVLGGSLLVEPASLDDINMQETFTDFQAEYDDSAASYQDKGKGNRQKPAAEEGSSEVSAEQSTKGMATMQDDTDVFYNLG